MNDDPGSNPNLAALRHAYRRWHETRGGSVDTWLDLIGDSFGLRSMAEGRAGAEFSSARSGRDEVAGYLRDLTGNWEMEYQTMDRFIADAGTIVAIGSTAWTNKATGKRCETQKVDLWEFRDGKAVSFTEFYDSAALLEAATPDAAEAGAVG